MRHTWEQVPAPRPLFSACQLCGLGIVVAKTGPIPAMHKACGRPMVEMSRVQHEAEALLPILDDAGKRRLRKLLMSAFMHWSNATFNEVANPNKRRPNGT